MTALRPDISPGSRVCHWPTRERGVIVRAVNAGYFGWRYVFQPDGHPNVGRLCTLDDLATIEGVLASEIYQPEPMHTGPSGGRAA